jgi:penicillin G amidase
VDSTIEVNVSILQNLLGAILRPALTMLSQTRLPITRGSLRLNGLHAPVEVLRDDLGIPHIFARNTLDALYAQGFVHAQERLWQMDFNRRLVQGRLAELLGEDALGYDRAMRTLGLRQVAEREATLMKEQFRQEMQAYCDGVNAGIAQNRLPVEFTLLGYRPEPWQIPDSLSYNKLMSWTLSANWESEVIRSRLIKGLGPEKAAELDIEASDASGLVLDAGGQLAGDSRYFSGPGPLDGVGSNNWVISGQRSLSGHPIFANDMHLVLYSPAIWYENHVCGGDLNLNGVSLPGVPLIISGHNGFVAWGYTNGFSDVQDLYEEHLRKNADGQIEYEYQGAWYPAEVHRETIRIKRKKPFIEEVVKTRHGPVINQALLRGYEHEAPLSLRWTTLEPESTVKAVFKMNCAKNCAEFHEALRDWSGPIQNTVYADTQGNIVYDLPGRIPMRAKGVGSVPVPGWSGEYEWTGYIPFDELPHIVNPPQGYMVTANNQVVGSNYPYFLSRDYVSPNRAERIAEMITAQEKLDVPAIQRMQFNQVSTHARFLAGLVGNLTGLDESLEEVGALMKAWDGNLAAVSPAAAVYEVLVRKILALIIDNKLGELGPTYRGKGPNPGLWGMHSWEWLENTLSKPGSAWWDLGAGQQRDDVLKLALQETLAFLQTELGPHPKSWAWGKLHRLTFRHFLGRQPILAPTFDRGPFPIGGDGNSIWASFTTEFDLSHRYVVGPPFRFIADLGDLAHARGLLAPGQSEHIASPHYADGIPAWFDQGYHVMLYNRKEIEDAAKERLALIPG